jgi:hypothetical protein
MAASTIGWFFIGLALIFAAVTIRDHRRTDGAPSPARRAWIRIALIFGLVGTTLQLARVIYGR